MLVYCAKHTRNSAPVYQNAPRVHTYVFFFRAPNENLLTGMAFILVGRHSPVFRSYSCQEPALDQHSHLARHNS